MSLNLKVLSFFLFALLDFVIFSSVAQCADEVRLDPNTLFVDEASEKWFHLDKRGHCINDQCTGNYNYLCKDSKENRVLRFFTSYTCTIRGLLETARREGKDFCYPGSLEEVATQNTLSLIKLKPPAQTLKIGTKYGTIVLRMNKETINEGFFSKKKIETTYILTYTQLLENSLSEKSYQLAKLTEDSAFYIIEMERQIAENKAEYTINLTELEKLKTAVKDKVITLNDEVFNRIFTRTKYQSY